MSYVQVSDLERRAPGAGDFDWPSIIEVLRANGYDGWLAVECLQQPESEACAVAAHRFLRAVIGAQA